MGIEISSCSIDFKGRQKRHETYARFLDAINMLLKFKSLGVKLFLLTCGSRCFEGQCFKILVISKLNAQILVL